MRRWVLAVVALALFAGVLKIIETRPDWPAQAWAFIMPPPPPPRARDIDPLQCLADLGAGRLAFTPVGDVRHADGCGVTGGVRVTGGAVAFSAGFLASCPLALALERFVAEAVQPAAVAAFGQPVRRIDHIGSYNCRPIRNSLAGSPSQHSYANALDLTGFVLADGTVVSVARHWPGDGPEAAFLRQVAGDACRYFRVVLTPDYDRLHAGHFHLDLGPGRLCR